MNEKQEKETEDGDTRPPAFSEPDGTYNERPTFIRVVNDREARERGGY